MKTLWEKEQSSGPSSDKDAQAATSQGSSSSSSADRSWFYEFTAREDRELDHRLVPHDILVNLAQAKALYASAVYNEEGFVKVTEALQQAWQGYENGTFGLSEDDEDVHSAVEKWLTERAGVDGARIHTGRSRNDQVLADMRLYMKEQACFLAEEWAGVAGLLLRLAREQQGLFFAGLTHTQPAMPHSVDAWACGYLDLLSADLSVLKQAYRTIDQSPLGSAAGYGVPHIPVDRQLLAKELGFSSVQEPVAASQLSRGRFELQMVDAMAYGALTFNRMASDVVLFMHPDWALVRLSDDQVSGSSIMPQKRNPDAWELIRSGYHDLQASRGRLSAIPANLVSGYHRDLQKVKKGVMEAFDSSLILARAVRYALSGLAFDEQACGRSLTPEVFATHEANRLVAEGMPFREAYRKVGTQLRAQAQGAAPIHPQPESLLKTYRHSGAPGSGVPSYLAEQIGAIESWIRGEKKALQQTRNRLLADVRSSGRPKRVKADEQER